MTKILKVLSSNKNWREIDICENLWTRRASDIEYNWTTAVSLNSSHNTTPAPKSWICLGLAVVTYNKWINYCRKLETKKRNFLPRTTCKNDEKRSCSLSSNKSWKVDWVFEMSHKMFLLPQERVFGVLLLWLCCVYSRKGTPEKAYSTKKEIDKR